MTAKGKMGITLAVLLVLTICVSVLSIAGMKLDAEGVHVLLPWLPITAGNVPRSLTLGLDAGSGNAADLTLSQSSEEDAAKIAADTVEMLKARFAAMGREVKVTLAEDGKIRIAYPKYVNTNETEDVSTAIQYAAYNVGQIEFLDENGEKLMGNEAFSSFRVQYYTSQGASVTSAASSAYALFLNLTADAKKLLDENIETLSMTMDGQEIFAAGGAKNYYSGSGIVLSLNSDSMARAYGAVITKGPLPVSVSALNPDANGEPAASAGTLHAILIVMWALFICASVLMIIRNRMAGLGGVWALWLFMVFFFFLIATVALPTLNILNWIAVILAVACAAYVCLLQLKGMDEAIASGRDARGAIRAGFHTTVVKAWIIHGGELVLALLLMLIPATRHFGYILACGCVASAAACIGLIRWFVPCVVAAFGAAAGNVSAKAAKK